MTSDKRIRELLESRIISGVDPETAAISVNQQLSGDDFSFPRVARFAWVSKKRIKWLTMSFPKPSWEEFSK